MDSHEIVFKDSNVMRQWDFAQVPVDHSDTGYIRDMLNRMEPDGAEWLVKFCRLVCAAVRGETDA